MACSGPEALGGWRESAWISRGNACLSTLALKRSGCVEYTFRAYLQPSSPSETRRSFPLGDSPNRFLPSAFATRRKAGCAHERRARCR